MSDSLEYCRASAAAVQNAALLRIDRRCARSMCTHIYIYIYVERERNVCTYGRYVPLGWLTVTNKVTLLAWQSDGVEENRKAI